MLDPISIVLGFSVVLFVFLYRYLTRYRDGSLEALGVPVVKPVFMFGSPPFRYDKLVVTDLDVERMKKYGKTWACYEGTSPTVYTMDPELLKTVYIKEAENFNERMDFPVPDRYMTMDIAGGKIWHALRRLLSPTFTSGKLKAMVEPIDGEIDKFIAFMEKKTKEGASVDVKDPLRALACTIISKCAFGIDVNYLEEEDQVYKMAKATFGSFTLSNILLSTFWNIVLHFRGLAMYFLPTKEMDFLINFTKDNIQSRSEEPFGARGDFIDRLREVLKDIKEDKELGKVLNEDLVIAQGGIFLTAGYETVAFTLATVMFNLAKQPEMQERIFNEVTQTLEDTDGKLDTDAINSMKYLESFINECMRLYGMIPRNPRMCTKDTNIGGKLFKKGMTIQVPVGAMHQNPEFFPEPETFNPDRFLPENAKDIVPLTFQPFGGGQRICLGMRFAMIEMKMVIAKTLLKFRIVAKPETEMEMEKGCFLFMSFKALEIGLVPRVEE